jgi:hypothetical protein
MPSRCPTTTRRNPALLFLATLALLLAACSSVSPTAAPQGSGAADASDPAATPTPTPSPTPTPAPTPIYTNPANPTLEGVIPDRVGSTRVVKPPVTEFGLTPGDVASVYGEIGDRFRSLALAYVEPRKLSLYAMTVAGDPVRTRDLEPYLATAGRYVGIAGLHREPWKLTAVGDHLVWVRPEDNATATGTMIYTWAADHDVFLMIGTDEKLNRAMLALLPGETPPPTPTPAASGSPLGSGASSGSGSASPTSSP